MTFSYKEKIFNLLDTPGHQDFSEDTYRVLTAVDSAVMVLDGAQGIETQTKRNFLQDYYYSLPLLYKFLDNLSS